MNLRAVFCKNKPWEKLSALAFTAYFILLVIPVLQGGNNYQWDFRGYYAAAKCYLGGLNPYDVKELYSVYKNIAELPFVYPPLAIYCFMPFTLLEPSTASIVYFLLKVAALIGLFYLWFKIYPERSYFVLFLAFSLLAFNAALYKDLITGNISIFEQLFIWLGISLFVRDKLWGFAICILLASVFKLLPIAFLALLLLSPVQNKRRVFIISSGVFLLYLGLNFTLEPTLTVYYLNSLSGGQLQVGGITNACSLFFFRSFIETFYANPSPYAFTALYLLFAGIITMITCKRLKPLAVQNTIESRLLTCFTLCLTIILVLPRFADYSYVLAILPVFWLITKKQGKAATFLLLILVCLSAQNVVIPVFKQSIELLWSYYTLIICFIVWLFYIKEAAHVVKERN